MIIAQLNIFKKKMIISRMENVLEIHVFASQESEVAFRIFSFDSPYADDRNVVRASKNISKKLTEYRHNSGWGDGGSNLEKNVRKRIRDGAKVIEAKVVDLAKLEMDVRKFLKPSDVEISEEKKKFYDVSPADLDDLFLEDENADAFSHPKDEQISSIERNDARQVAVDSLPEDVRERMGSLSQINDYKDRSEDEKKIEGLRSLLESFKEEDLLIDQPHDESHQSEGQKASPMDGDVITVAPREGFLRKIFSRKKAAALPAEDHEGKAREVADMPGLDGAKAPDPLEDLFADSDDRQDDALVKAEKPDDIFIAPEGGATPFPDSNVFMGSRLTQDPSTDLLGIHVAPAFDPDKDLEDLFGSDAPEKFPWALAPDDQHKCWVIDFKTPKSGSNALLIYIGANLSSSDISEFHIDKAKDGGEFVSGHLKIHCPGLMMDIVRELSEASRLPGETDFTVKTVS